MLLTLFSAKVYRRCLQLANSPKLFIKQLISPLLISHLAHYALDAAFSFHRIIQKGMASTIASDIRSDVRDARKNIAFLHGDTALSPYHQGSAQLHLHFIPLLLRSQWSPKRIGERFLESSSCHNHFAHERYIVWSQAKTLFQEEIFQPGKAWEQNTQRSWGCLIP